VARNAPKSIDHEPKTMPAPMRGGAPGVPPPAQPSPFIHGLSSVHPGVTADPFAQRPEPKLKRYRVVGGKKRMMSSTSTDSRGATVIGQSYWDGSFSILYDGVPCRVHFGKEFKENQMDADQLRRQGIILEEILDGPPEAAADHGGEKGSEEVSGQSRE
jgi:hypothetical protein